MKNNRYVPYHVVSSLPPDSSKDAPEHILYAVSPNLYRYCTVSNMGSTVLSGTFTAIEAHLFVPATDDANRKVREYLMNQAKSYSERTE